MRIAFRVDASSEMGSGHLMRCAALAETAFRQGCEILFIGRSLPTTFQKTLSNSGYAVHQLPHAPPSLSDDTDLPSHAAWLGTDWNIDAAQTSNALDQWGACCDWLVIDHYALDARWEERIREKHINTKILVIDDLADRKHCCDALLDQNISLDENRYETLLLNKECSRMYGPRYALLRSEFSERRATITRPPASLHNILISYGGSDPAGESLKCLKGLSLLKDPDLNIMVIAGALNPKKAELQELAASCGASYEDQVSDMAARMSWADLAFGAPGSTTWERFCLGVNTVVTAIVPEQLPAAELLAKKDLVVSLGEYTNTTPSDYSNALIALNKNPNFWEKRCNAIMKLVDGLGVQRVIDKLKEEGSTTNKPTLFP